MEALRRLAGAQSDNTTGKEGATVQAPFAPTIPGSSSPRSASRIARQWPFWLALVVIISLVAVVVVSIFAHAAPKQTVLKSAPHPIEITPTSDSITCPTDFTWSPNQQMIAVVGYAVGCPTPSYAEGIPYLTSALYQGSTQFSGTGIVAIYDAANGTRLAAFSPDSAVYQTIERQELFSSAYTAWLATVGDSPQQSVAINYTHALWTPNQQRLMVTFTCFLPAGPPIKTAAGLRLPGRMAQGLVISDLHGQHMQVALHVASGQSAGMMVWDIGTARVVSEATASAPFTLQPAALGYSWESSGALTPQTPLSSDAPPTSSNSQPVGAPLEGAASFTIWQPGVLTTTLPGRMPGQPNLNGVAAFFTDFVALSPDGHYLASSVGLAGLIVGSSGPTVSATTLAQYGWQTAPRLPLHDAGLGQALTGQSDGAYLPIAWRPDGREVAVSGDTTNHAVTLYDCSSGKPLKTLTPPAVTASNVAAQISLLAWSPDGHELGFYDSSTGILTLWNHAFLPA